MAEMTRPMSCTTAICSPPCAHGGTCMRWNKCLCLPGWTGAGCHTGRHSGARAREEMLIKCPLKDFFLLSLNSLTCLLAVCDLPCANNGRCVGPNTCQCPSDYTGPQCLWREYLQQHIRLHFRQQRVDDLAACFQPCALLPVRTGEDASTSTSARASAGGRAPVAR